MNNEVLAEMPTARYARRPKNLPFTLTALARQTDVTEKTNCGIPLPFPVARINIELARVP